MNGPVRMKVLLAMVAAAWLPSAAALPAEAVRSGDDEVSITWDAAAGPVDVFQYFRTGTVERQLISAADADGMHQQPSNSTRPYFILRAADGTEHEIAEAMDLTEARISQIHTQAILALRSFIERNQNK